LLLNVERANLVMDRQELDALVATSAVNVTYLSDFRSLGQQYLGTPIYTVLPRSDWQDATLILPLGESREVVGNPLSWIDDLRPYGSFFIYSEPHAQLDAVETKIRALTEAPRPRDSLEALAQALSDKGLAGARVGLDPGNLPLPFSGVTDWLTKRCPAIHLRNARDAFMEIRKVKTKEEVDRLRTAVRITEEGIAAVLRLAQPGVSGVALAREFTRTVHARGAFYAVPGIGLGRKSYLNSVTKPTSAQLAIGDQLRFDAGCVYQFYSSDIARTAVLGPASPRQQTLYDAVLAGEEAVIRALKPGVKASDLFRIGVDAVQSAGIPSYDRNHIGHGIGLQTYDRPVLTPDNDATIEEGMVIDIEIPYYVVGLGGFHVEDTLLVTASGSELLTTLDRGLLTVEV
jgi:Xaa-Pro aminopeptidase